MSGNFRIFGLIVSLATVALAEPDPAPARRQPAPPQVVLEPIHKLYERPRPAGAVHAAVQDEELARWNVGGTSDPEYVSSRARFHPGARVVVDTTVVSAPLPSRTERAVLAQSRKYGYWPFRLCFEDGLRRDQKLHGPTRIRISIGSSGRVGASRLLDSKLGDDAVADCLTAAASELKFGNLARRRIDVDLSVKLWPGDAPVPRVGPPAGEDVRNPGQLDRSRLEPALASALEKIGSCYESARTRDPGLWGRLQLRVDQDPSGRVLRVLEDESRFPDPEVARCAVETVTEVALPAPRGGALAFVFALRLGSPP